MLGLAAMFVETTLLVMSAHAAMTARAFAAVAPVRADGRSLEQEARRSSAA